MWISIKNIMLRKINWAWKILCFTILWGLKASKESNSQSLTVHYDLPCVLKYREIRKIQLEEHGFFGVNKNALKLI